jgi:hypothetical protein
VPGAVDDELGFLTYVRGFGRCVVAFELGDDLVDLLAAAVQSKPVGGLGH